MLIPLQLLSLKVSDPFSILLPYFIQYAIGICNYRQDSLYKLKDLFPADSFEQVLNILFYKVYYRSQ